MEVKERALLWSGDDFDRNGVFYHLGTLGGRREFRNPAEENLILVTSAPLKFDSDPIHVFVGRDARRGVVDDTPSGWFCVDLLTRWLIPTSYTLRHYNSKDSHALRSWRFEASTNNSQWDVLLEHINDTSLSTKAGTATWQLTSVTKAYRAFRIVMTAPNSSGSYSNLCCGGMELYGIFDPNADYFDRKKRIDDARPSLRFAYTSDFDTHGILYYLGTKQGTADYANPLDIGAVRVMSAPLKIDSDPLSVFVGRDDRRGVVDNMEGGWFTVDFLLHAVMPTHYSLRHYNSKDSHALRSWRFEASNNGHTWECIREHKQDTSLYRKSGSATWQVTATRAYRFFRILMIGTNSSEYFFNLCCSGFEIYGTLDPPGGSIGSAAIIAADGRLATTIPAATPIASGSNTVVLPMGPPMTPVRFSSQSSSGSGSTTPFGLAGDVASLTASSSGQPLFHIPGSPASSIIAFRGPVYQPPSLQLPSSSSLAHGERKDNNHLEVNGHDHTNGTSSSSTNSNSSEREFTYRHDFDMSGVLYWLGTDRGNRDAYINPAITGAVAITSSPLKIDSDPLHVFVGRELKRGVLDDTTTKNGWLCVDLLSWSLRPSYYTLRHYDSQDSHALRSWRVDASKDGVHWTLLREHRLDPALNRKGATYTWSLPSDKGSFRMFRLMITDKNSSSHYDNLCLSGLELYGKLAPYTASPVRASTTISISSSSSSTTTSSTSTSHHMNESKSAMVDLRGVQDLLTTLGLSDHWPNFVKEGVTRVDTLKLLDDAALRELVPQMGPRAQLKRWLDQEASSPLLPASPTGTDNSGVARLVYKEALSAVIANGIVTPAEVNVLATLQRQCHISDSVALGVLLELGVPTERYAEMKRRGEQQTSGSMIVTSMMPSSSSFISQPAAAPVAVAMPAAPSPPPGSTSDKYQCVICLCADADHAILDCMHMCLCGECAATFVRTTAGNKCPKCRAPVRKIQRIFV